MRLNEHYMRLIAIGASVAANCQPCLEINLERARECGAEADEISQAIWVGRMVRKGAASKLDDYSATLFTSSYAPRQFADSDCGCKED